MDKSALVAEANDFVRCVLQYGLENKGYVVQALSSLKKARIPGNKDFGVYIVSENAVSGTSAKEMLRNLKDYYKHISALRPNSAFFFLANTEEMLEEARREGISAYHRKGDEFSLDIIEKAVAGRAA